MKTVFIYNQMEMEVKFFVLDGDFSRFDGVYINEYCSKEREKLQRELCDVIYHPTSGQENPDVVMLDSFPVDVVKENDVIVIVSGFLP